MVHMTECLVCINTDTEEKRVKGTDMSQVKPVEAQEVEPIIAVLDFINAKRSSLCGKTVVARQLYADILKYIEQERLEVYALGSDF